VVAAEVPEEVGLVVAATVAVVAAAVAAAAVGIESASKGPTIY